MTALGFRDVRPSAPPRINAIRAQKHALLAFMRADSVYARGLGPAGPSPVRPAEGAALADPPLRA
ncbi:MAG: hypothetical protein K0S37_1465 [Microbacterium sp.]|nr:hypothetical protein [Microbacterium sp.]